MSEMKDLINSVLGLDAVERLYDDIRSTLWREYGTVCVITADKFLVYRRPDRESFYIDKHGDLCVQHGRGRSRIVLMKATGERLAEVRLGDYRNAIDPSLFKAPTISRPSQTNC